MPPSPSFDIRRAMLIGLVVPVAVSLLDRWLLAREFGPRGAIAAVQAMTCFVLQVGAYGFLCGRYIEPAWFRWMLFGWCLLITDLNAAASFSPRIGLALCEAQVELVVMWIVLGTSPWKLRLAAALLVSLPALVSMVQTSTLCLICLVLRSQRYRLFLAAEDSEERQITTAADANARRVQFGIGDVLLWTTALSPLLALSRLGIGTTLVQGVLQAVVLMVALWSALGSGPYWLRWPSLAVFGLAAGLVWADFHIYRLRWWSWFGAPPAWFSRAHWEMLYWQWDQIVPFLLTGAMLAATLLIFRVRGYRLCRDRRLKRKSS